MEIELKTGLIGVNGIECTIAYRLYGEKDPPVVFLHGFSFDRNTWIKAGIVEGLLARKIDVVLIDMPYGRKTSCTKHSRSVDLNVSMLEEAVNRLIANRPPLIVGASLGGRIALYYAIGRRVSGLFLASPALKEDEPIWKHIKAIQSPAVIVRGSSDFIPKKIHEKLARKLKAELMVYDAAGHAMYLDQPERFVNDLLDLYNKVSIR